MTVADWHQTRRFSFTQSEVVVGRDREADLVLERDGVEPCHLRIALHDGALYVDDLHNSLKPIKPDDVVRVAGVELRVSLVPLVPEDVTDDTERALLDEIRARPDEPAPRLVYADWLDDHRCPERAEFLRIQLAAATDQLRELSLVVGVGWRALVATVRIEGCVSLRACPMRWDKLAPTDHAGIRACATCKQTVTYCTSMDQARTIAQSGGRIAVDTWPLRHEFDLEGPLMGGRPSPPFSRYGRRTTDG